MKNKIDNEIFLGFFTLKGRTERLEFFKVYSMVFLLGIINYVYFLPGARNAYVWGYIIVYCLILLSIFPMTVRRLHDSNLNGGYYLVSLAPSLLSFIAHFTSSEVSFLLSLISFAAGIYFLYLTLRKGSAGVNNYGMPNPAKKYGRKKINAILLGLFFLIIVSGILSGV